MDIAYYLSELLEQLGEVNVPGLGSFTRVKVDGYYNNDEGRFYPPASKIEFDPHYIDDDVLARYIGVKKRISLASSKYFTEKYLNGLRQEVMSKSVRLADIGLLYFENGEMRFKATEALPDPAFFGYPQIVLNKLGDAPIVTNTIPVAEPEREPEPEVEEEIEEHSAVVVHHEPRAEEHETLHDDGHEGHGIDEAIILEETITRFEEHETLHDDGHEGHGIDEAIVADETVTQIEESEPLHDGGQEAHGIGERLDNFTKIFGEPLKYEDDSAIFNNINNGEAVEEEERPRSYKWLWITLIILVVAGGGIFGWLYYQQMQQPKMEKKAAPVLPKDTTDSIRSLDTVKNLPVGDTGKQAATTVPPQNAPASTIDSTKIRYEVIGAQTRTQTEADKIIGNYKSLGLDAHVVSDAPGRRLKISLGTYTSKTEAIAAANALSAAKKVKGAWPLQINPKK